MGDCKTSIRRFESARRLQQFRYEFTHFSRLVMVVDMLIVLAIVLNSMIMGG